MAKEKGKPGRPHVLIRRHKIELPEELLALAESFSKDYKKPMLPRVIGAGITAAGVYMLTMAFAAITKKIITTTIDVTTGVSFGVVNFFTGLFSSLTKVAGPGIEIPQLPQSLSTAITEATERALPGVTTLAIGLGVTAGGMVLAGQNPAVIISGIAAMIDALIPG